MLAAIVLVGGVTRLTESGLSITEWQPVMGALPPLSEAQWLTEFQRYQQIPQYHELNSGMVPMPSRRYSGGNGRIGCSAG